MDHNPPRSATEVVLCRKLCRFDNLPCSAGFQRFQPAVSPISNRQTPRNFKSFGIYAASAGWKPAIQQVGNLRYFSDRTQPFWSAVAKRSGDTAFGRLLTCPKESGV